MVLLTVKETAALLNISERAVRKATSQSRYNFRYINGIGRGGKVLQIELESLPEKAQAKYYSEHKEEAPPDFDFTKYQSAYTGQQREVAEYKAHILHSFWRSGLSVEKFLIQFNQKENENITLKQLYDWQKKYKEFGHNIEFLVDARGAYNKDVCSIPDDVWQDFYSIYMTQQKRTVQRCWELTKLLHDDIPAVPAFYRKVRTIPAYAILKYREGNKKFNDSLPYMVRDKACLKSNDIWFSDHHRSDVFVVNQKGEAVRLWITVFTDALSTKVISCIAYDADPNTSKIKKCLRYGMEKYGVPKEIYTDNGKDYKSKELSKDYPLSLINNLGIGKIHAQPYHGQAKPVERFFGTLEDRFGKLFNTYAGNDAKKRPECMQISNKEIAKIAPTMDYYIEKLNDYIEEYNNTKHSGLGQTPNEAYFENLTSKQQISDPNVLRLLCGRSVERTVQRNGISLYGNFFTNFDGSLIPYYKKKVIVTYDPDDMETLYLFDMEYKFISKVNAKIKTMFRGNTEDDYLKAQKEIKKVRTLVKKYKPVREMDVMSIIAKNKLAEKQYQEQTISTTEIITSHSTEAQRAFDDTEITSKKRKGSVYSDIQKYYEREKA